MSEKELIEEFLSDLKSIDCGINDYGDNLADGDQLDKIIKKWVVYLDRFL